MINIAMIEPDQAANVGAMMRLCACFGVHLHLVDPMGFPFDLQRFRRTGLDYVKHCRLTRHTSVERILEEKGRKLLMTTRSELSYLDYAFQSDDILCFGSESHGAPDILHDGADDCLTIPMQPPARSLNVVTSAAVVLGEVYRQNLGT